LDVRTQETSANSTSGEYEEDNVGEAHRGKKISNAEADTLVAAAENIIAIIE
jgi:hypothetical protein